MKRENHRRNKTKYIHTFFPKYKEHRGKEHWEITIENTFQKADEKKKNKENQRIDVSNPRF